MSKIRWKENKILSIETRKGLFVIAQMLKEPYLLFYNLFSTNRDWENIDLKDKSILFYSAVAREFLNSSNIYTQTLVAEPVHSIDKFRIKIESVFRDKTLWKGTPHEIEILINGEGGVLIEKNLYKEAKAGSQEVIVADIDNQALVDEYDLDRILFYPLLNERLYLCHKFGKNVDPLKDLIFDRDIPLDYEVYIKLYADKITEDEWSNLSSEF